LADSYRMQNQPARALEELKAVAARHPESAPLHRLLGQWLANNGDHAAARAEFTAAKGADPRYPAADLALAQLDILEGHTEPAPPALNSVLSRDKRNTAARLMLAGIYQKNGDPAAAIAQYRTVLGLDGSNLLALNNLAYLTAKSNPDEALQFAQQAVEYAPTNPSVLDTLG